MIIKPKVRGFICTAAHPQGCMAMVKRQADYVLSQPKITAGPKKVLVIGASTGYGLASRITAAFASDAKTLGVMFEKPPAGKRTASAGWYNTWAFETLATQAGLYARSINGDAFSDAIKAETIAAIKEDLGQVDLVVYSLASPRRKHPKSGELHSSVLKTVATPFTSKTVDPITAKVSEVTIPPASDEEIANTVAVMGGEDWSMWIDALLAADVLAPGAKTCAYTYLGPELTHPIYHDGSIGQAKADLHATSNRLNQLLSQKIQGSAFISVNKAVVTQSSAAIPIVPLYIAILFKVMKAHGNHEGCIEQMYRLFHDAVYANSNEMTDEKGYIRLDDFEMLPEIQQEVMKIWPEVNDETVNELTDLSGYWQEFMQLFGFELEGINYDADVEVNEHIPSLVETCC